MCTRCIALDADGLVIIMITVVIVHVAGALAALCGCDANEPNAMQSFFCVDCVAFYAMTALGMCVSLECAYGVLCHKPRH